MKTKQDPHINIARLMKTSVFVLYLVFSGCGGQDETVTEQDEIRLSDKEITIEIDGWKPMPESRATLFESLEDLKDDGTDEASKPGGNFTLYGYLSGKGSTFLGGARAYWYEWENTKEWRFLTKDAEGKDKVITYYWPNSDKVNFFAYMPYKDYTDMNHYVNTFQYTETGGQTFNCTLPNTNMGDDAQVEFIYAYETDKTAADNPLKLHFKHPFAAIYFRLSPESSRMTVNDITLNDVYLNGTFSVSANEWTPDGETSNYIATIDKRIPNDVNYNTIFAGPFLMMPQELSNQVSLTLNATRDTEGTAPVNATAQLSGKWEPAKKYIYTLTVGERNEEIYFNVAVEDWIVVSYKNEINVE